jgi:hypothetical protein
LIEKELSGETIGNILGLDWNDPAEREIVFSAVEDLIQDEMVDGDESAYWLTEIGKEYAKEGVKFATFERLFSLYYDWSGITVDTKNIFDRLEGREDQSQDNVSFDYFLDEIQALAELQAPEVHFPKNKVLLQDAEVVNEKNFSANVWVVLLENFRDKTFRTLVYNEKEDKIIEPLSEVLDTHTEIKEALLEKIMNLDKGREKGDSYAEDTDFALISTEEEKQEVQLTFENELIQAQEEVEKAIERHDFVKIKEIEKKIVASKRHFNSFEFETELKRLFEKTANDLWIISPWIKRYAIEKRISYFEEYLRKRGRLFIAYSEPETSGSVMADEATLNQLTNLEKEYPNFYLLQLPIFHYKRVWFRNNEGKDIYYTGSYNVLSFFVKDNQQRIRQEEMVKLDWNEEEEKVYKDILSLFGRKYLDQVVEDFNILIYEAPSTIDRSFLQEIKSFGSERLKPFINHNLDTFDKPYTQFQTRRSEKLRGYRKQLAQNEARKLQEEVKSSSLPVSEKEKKYFLRRWDSFQNEFREEIEGSEELKKLADIIFYLEVFESDLSPLKSNKYPSKKSNKRNQ